MKKGKLIESQIIQILESHEGGRSVSDLCREYGMSDGTFYKWCKQYGDMEVDQLKQFRDLEEENWRLKHMYAELSLDQPRCKSLC